MFAKLIFSILWSLAFIGNFCMICLVIAIVRSAHFRGNSAWAAFSVSPWVLGAALALGLVGFILGFMGKLPGPR